MVFRPIEIHHPYSIFFIPEQVEGGIIGILVPQFSQLDQGKPHRILVFLCLYAGHVDVVQSGEIHEIVPARNAVFDVIDHLFPQFRIIQPFDDLVSASVMDPRRQDDPKHGAAGHIRILVVGNIDTFFFSFFQQLHHPIDFIPVFPAADLEMGIMDLDPRFFADLDHFFHRIQDCIGFTALVDDETAVIFSNHLAHFHYFFGLPVRTGHIDQASGQTDGPIFHFPTDDVFHLFQLSFSRLPVVQAHGFHPHIAMGNQITFIGSGLHAFDHL